LNFTEENYLLFLPYRWKVAHVAEMAAECIRHIGRHAAHDELARNKS
jgi:hypothetical protein